MCVLRSGHLTRSPPPSGWPPYLTTSPTANSWQKKPPLKVKQVRGCSCKTAALPVKTLNCPSKGLFTRPLHFSAEASLRGSCTACPAVHRVDSPLNTADTAPAHFTSWLSFKLKHTPTPTSASLCVYFPPLQLTCLTENLRQPWTRKPCSPVLPPRPCTAVRWSIRPRLVRIATQLRPVLPSVHLYPYNIHTLFVSWM